MKKVVILALAFLGAALVLGIASCGNAASDSSGAESAALSAAAPEGCVYVPAKTFDGMPASPFYSFVFIKGRKLSLPAIYVCDHEVTQKEYHTYCLYAADNLSPRDEYGKGDNHPVYWVSWYDAIVYCNQKSKAEGLNLAYKMKIGGEYKKFPEEWPGIQNGRWGGSRYCGPAANDDNWNAIEFDTSANGWRLPTEAEWEMLVRGGNLTNVGQTRYSGSNDFKEVAWCIESCNPYGMFSHEVKTKAKNGLGLYDMSGNVFEWCWDFYNEIDSTTPWTGPAKAKSAAHRSTRGGSWGFPGSLCIVATRCGDYFGADYHNENFGFRVVRNAQ